MGEDMRKIKKTIFLLNINGFAKEITDITYPLIKFYARKIGAEIHLITERKFPEFPVTYEKLQIYELAKESDSDWFIYLDSDTLIHPETIDFTQYLSKNTIAHNGTDFASFRWRYDRFFLRDGRDIGSCNWNTWASNLCIELWKPLDDMTCEEALDNIYPTVNEVNTVIDREHLIDDYVLSRNIAKYGLKVKTLIGIQKELGLTECNFFWHAYTLPPQEKVVEMKKVLAVWKIEEFFKRIEK